jgi:hypothetical protein
MMLRRNREQSGAPKIAPLTTVSMMLGVEIAANHNIIFNRDGRIVSRREKFKIKGRRQEHKCRQQCRSIGRGRFYRVLDGVFR